MNHIELYKILVVDDHPLYRKGLKKVLSTLSFPHSIHLLENGEQTLDFVKTNQPDLVLLDIDMPIMDGLKCLQELKKIAPDVKVAMISMHDDAHYIEQAYSLGANGYLLKDCDSDELHKAVLQIKSGDKYFNAVAKDIIFKRFIEKEDAPTEAKNKLSERETEVLKLICEQLTGTQIAQKLFLSEETVKTYRRQLLKKTNSKNLAGLVLYAIKKGIYLD
jgi:DNA-binding NarL/FixJ family response regulator